MTSGLWANAGETPNRLLFRVHHNASGTMRSADGGFATQNRDWLRTEDDFYNALQDHLVIDNDEPTPFISVGDSATLAADRARWMRESGCRNVRIFVIDPSAVGKIALHVRRAANYLQLGIPNRVYRFTAGERVYLRDIPGYAVVKEYSNIDHFCRAYGGSGGIRELGTS